MANKIKVEGTVVELDGDEMTRIIWQFIKDRLTHPYPDGNREDYDPGLASSDALGPVNAEGKPDRTHLAPNGQRELGAIAAREFLRLFP